METETPTKPKRTRTVKPTAAPETAFTKRDFGNIAKMFEGETNEVQLALIETSGRLQLVKLNLKEEAAVIAWIVRNRYPGTSNEDLLAGLRAGYKKLAGDTLPEVLTNLIGKTSEMSDTEWNSFWHRMFLHVAAPLLPFAKIVMYSEYVYQVLVKPNVK